MRPAARSRQRWHGRYARGARHAVQPALVRAARIAGGASPRPRHRGSSREHHHRVGDASRAELHRARRSTVALGIVTTDRSTRNRSPRPRVEQRRLRCRAAAPARAASTQRPCPETALLPIEATPADAGRAARPRPGANRERFQVQPSAAPAALPPLELARVTEHVLESLDRRMSSWRERRGRSLNGARESGDHQHQHGDRIPVQFNPEEYTVNRDINFAQAAVPGTERAAAPVRARQHADAGDGAAARHVRSAPGAAGERRR